MSACTQCDGFMESISIDKPREYLEFARRLLDSINDGTITLAQSTCPLEDLFKADWPNDIVEHNFECSACGRSFQLFADTFHGHAGWGLTGPPRSKPEEEKPPVSTTTIELGCWTTNTAN
jgi:hypothetical protein